MNSDESRIAECAQREYGIEVEAVKRIYMGLGTRNWLACVSGQRFFVKEYRRESDLAKEDAALELCEYAYQCGIPTPRVIRTASKKRICVCIDSSFALFEYVSGASSGGILSLDQMAEAGRTLGEIHYHLKRFKTRWPSVTPNWVTFDKAEKEREIRRYLQIIEQKERPDDFDRVTYEKLVKKMDMLGKVSRLLGDMPDLPTQVIHNDYSSPNLLFRGSSLVAVVDFQCPAPFLVPYEIGRIALTPENLESSQWMEKAVALVGEYCRANEVDGTAIAFAPDISLIQLIRSLYGVKQHYLGPLESQRELDQFWFRRVNAAELIAENLERLKGKFEDTWHRVKSRRLGP